MGLHTHLRESLLVPKRANDEGYKAAFLEPAQRQFGTQGQEVPDLIQVQGADARDRDEGCGRGRTRVTQWSLRCTHAHRKAGSSGHLHPPLECTHALVL